MTNLILASLLVFFTISEEYPKGTKEISFESGKSLIEVGKMLVSDGYTIAKLDTTFGYLETDFKSIKSIQTKMVVRAANGKVKLSGTFLSGMTIEIYGVRSEDTPEPIVKRGMKNSPFLNAWNELERVATLLQQ